MARRVITLDDARSLLDRLRGAVRWLPVSKPSSARPRQQTDGIASTDQERPGSDPGHFVFVGTCMVISAARKEHVDRAALHQQRRSLGRPDSRVRMTGHVGVSRTRELRECFYCRRHGRLRAGPRGIIVV